MIKNDNGMIELKGNFGKLMSEYVSLVAGMRKMMEYSFKMEKEEANRILVEGLFMGVGLADGKNGSVEFEKGGDADGDTKGSN